MMTPGKLLGYIVVNPRTGVEKRYTSLSQALRAANRIDNAHGAYIARRLPIYEQIDTETGEVIRPNGF